MIAEILGAGGALLSGLGALGIGQSKHQGPGLHEWHMQYQQQQNLIHNQIANRVADAKRAGIHPLAALGVSPYSPSPQYVGGHTKRGPDLVRAGQDISRAVSAFQTSHQKRMQTYERMIKREQIKALKLGNVRAATELQESRQPGIVDQNTGIAHDYVGVGNNANRSVNWIAPKKSIQDKAGMEAGIGPGYKYSRRPDGSVVMSLSEENAEAVESDWFAQLQNVLWRLGDYFEGYGMIPVKKKDVPRVMAQLKKMRPPQSRARRGRVWRYNIFKGAWYDVPFDGNRNKITVHKWLKY